MTTLERKLSDIINYAKLAPSRSNNKPWQLKVEKNQIYIFADYSKRLEATDPFNRELFISLGCVIANIEIAAEHYQLHYDTYIFTGNEIENLIAIITFSLYKNPKQVYPVPLFGYIPLRHTNRNAYATKDISPEDKDLLLNALSWIDNIYVYTSDNQNLKDYFADLTNQAELEQFNNPEFRHEQRKWLAPKDDTDGMPLSAYHLSRLSSVLFSLNPDYNFGNHKAFFDTHAIKAAPTIGVLMTEKDEKADWISTGIAFQVLALRATALGLAYQPMTSILEIPYTRRKVQDIIESTKVPQMFFRIGYPLKLSNSLKETHYNVSPNDMLYSSAQYPLIF